MTPRTNRGNSSPGSAPRPARKKSLGQHFLNSGRVVSRIIDALAPDPDVTVVEVGPGRGALTRQLSSGCNRLVLVELDDDLIPILGENFPKATIIHHDAATLDMNLAARGERAVAVGNLPYNAGGQILFNLLDRDPPFERLVLMFQKEVALRLCAVPGDRNHGAVSVLVSLLCDRRYLFDVSPSKFIPPPAVMSGVVAFTPRLIQPDMSFVRRRDFFQFVHGLFAQPRKTVANSMIDGLRMDRPQATRILGAAEVDPDCRPNCLTPEQIVKMFRA